MPISRRTNGAEAMSWSSLVALVAKTKSKASAVKKGRSATVYLQMAAGMGVDGDKKAPRVPQYKRNPRNLLAEVRPHQLIATLLMDVFASDIPRSSTAGSLSCVV